jgi:UDP-N-acetylmuramate-alanine ligase
VSVEAAPGKRRVFVTDDVAAAMCAWILENAGLEPGFVFERTALDFGARSRAGTSRRKIVGGSAAAAPYVIAGRPPEDGAPTDIHVFGGVPFHPASGAILVVADVAWEDVLRDRDATFVALDTDRASSAPAWIAAIARTDVGAAFDLYAGGSYAGRFSIAQSNVRSALLAIATCAHGFNVHIEDARRALASFRGLA